MTEEKSNQKKIDRAREWRAVMAMLIGGLLLFETLTGVVIYLLPFSLPMQFTVLTHTIVGLIFIFPYAWYQIRHWLINRREPMTHSKVTGFLSMVAILVCSASGVVLTIQAVFFTRISYLWDTIHVVSTVAIIAFSLPHIVMLVVRNRRLKRKDEVAPVLKGQRRYGWVSVAITAVLVAGTALWIYAYNPVQFDNTFPEDYVFTHGEEAPFTPSLARTSTGGAFDARSLSGSRSCGTSGCHEEIVAEWESSAHRYSALDAAFQTVQGVMAQQNGAESTRYCGGCHDPISLFSGAKNVFVDDLTGLAGYQEGVSCLVCHAITETDVMGNASYLVVQPDRYAYEFSDGATVTFLRDFLIRAYPRQHVASLSNRLFKSPEFCGACHKQFIDQEINKVGWVQLQNQYDNWRMSRWNTEGDATKTIECRECHMPLVANSTDPASGDALDYNRAPDDGTHRSHRFLGANQFIPILHELPGGVEHRDLTEQWLRGEIEISEIADKWESGPAVPIELALPERVDAGEEVAVEVILLNNKPGHDFPTGPLDIIQAWVEIVVTDEEGNVVYSSGTLDENHFIEPGSFIFKAEAVDQYGNLIDRHNLWEMVGVRYRRTLFPGFSDVALYSFDYTGGSQELQVEAKLQYRKIDQFFLNFLYGEDSGLTTPVTTVSEAVGTISVHQVDSGS